MLPTKFGQGELIKIKKFFIWHSTTINSQMAHSNDTELMDSYI
jgi:hypothetical protein